MSFVCCYAMLHNFALKNTLIKIDMGHARKKIESFLLLAVNVMHN